MSSKHYKLVLLPIRVHARVMVGGLRRCMPSTSYCLASSAFPCLLVCPACPQQRHKGGDLSFQRHVPKFLQQYSHLLGKGGRQVG